MNSKLTNLIGDQRPPCGPIGPSAHPRNKKEGCVIPQTTSVYVLPKIDFLFTWYDMEFVVSVNKLIYRNMTGLIILPN